jgi:hypothetical protein
MHFVFTYELQQNYILEQLEQKYFICERMNILRRPWRGLLKT